MKSEEENEDSPNNQLTVCRIVFSFFKFDEEKMVKKGEFEGKKILITGGGSGIGRLMAIRFASAGGDIILWDIRLDLIEETKQIILSKYPTITVTNYQCDISQREIIYETCDKMLEEVGAIDILINNAGIVSGKKFLDCPDELIVKTMAVNAMAHMWIAKKLLPPMLLRNSGPPFLFILIIYLLIIY